MSGMSVRHKKQSVSRWNLHCFSKPVMQVLICLRCLPLR